MGQGGSLGTPLDLALGQMPVAHHSLTAVIPVGSRFCGRVIFTA
jgi:hypothetical protein